MKYAEMSPAAMARVSGALYLFSIAARIVADGFVRDRLVKSGDAALTAANLRAHETLVTIGFSADIVAFAAFVAVAAILYGLLRPASRTLSLTALLFATMSATTQAVSSVFQLGATFVAQSPEYLRVFPAEQLNALALLLFRLRSITFHTPGLFFLGLWCLLVGWVAFRSGLLPKTVGLLMCAAGVAYLPYLVPTLPRYVMPYHLIPAGVGQIAFALWLLVFGVKAPKATGGEKP